jgi:outer membrane protein assembly factor BamB
VGQVVPILGAEPELPAASPWHQNPAGWQPPRPSAKIIREPAPEEPAEAKEDSAIKQADWRTAPPPKRGQAPAPPPAPKQPPRSAASRAPVENDWRQAGPAPRSASAPPAEKSPASHPAPTPSAPATVAEDAPLELVDEQWEGRQTPAAGSAPDFVEPLEEFAASRKRRSKWLMLGVLGLLLITLGGVGGVLYYLHVTGETFLAEQAQKDYDQKLYAKAENEFRELHERFPDSTDAGKYAFMQDLSAIRKLPEGLGIDWKESLRSIEAFLRDHREDEWLADHLQEVGETYVRIVKEQVLPKVPARPTRKDEEWLVTAEQTLSAMNDPALMPAVSAKDRQDITAEFTRIRQDIAREEQRLAYLAELNRFKPTIDGLRDAERFIRERGLGGDAEAKAILDQLFAQHPRSVQYTTAAAVPPAAGARKEETGRSLLVNANLGDNPPAPVAAEDGIVLALVRGVLYALRQADGEVQWAMRVGIDTTNLPVDVPATPFNPELILVQSADSLTLTALDTSGRQVWQYHLSAPVLGRPVIIKKRAFLPTFDGQIHEIELARGTLLGRYTLGPGARLSFGGVHQPGTNLVYFPADEWCVFVLDVEKHTCETVLYTKHPSASLRSEPIVASWMEKDDAGQRIPLGFLFLSLADELNSMHLTAYALPVENPRAEPVPMAPEPRFQGWTWFSPYQDAEKLVLVTDAGKLSLLGVKQQRNEDNPLFLMVPPKPGETKVGIDLDPFLHARAGVHGRAQIAHAAEPDDFWVLAHGKLDQLRLLLTSKDGPTVQSVWKEPLELGSPLHAAQVFEYPFEPGALKATTVFLVTQPLDRETVLATAVDAATGNVRWQRQLGMISRGEPLQLGKQLLTLDQGGGLFTFDPSKFQDKSKPWQAGGHHIAGALDESQVSPVLLPGPDGKSAYEIAIPATAVGANSTLILRRYPGQGGNTPVLEKAIQLNDRLTLGGTPAVGEGGILVPLSDGTIRRFDLQGNPKGEGPNWRAGRDEPEVQTHIVWLSNEDFITTNGTRQIFRWHWPAGMVGFATVPERKDAESTLDMPARIVTAPLALAPEAGRAAVRALVACNDGNLYLVEGKEKTAVRGEEPGLKIVKDKQWKLRGRITAGPFFLGNDVGVIVDRNRLVRITWDKPEPVWEYKSQAEAIVGIPQIIDDLLVVADQAGHFIGLDPGTSKPRGKGYKLHTSAGPAASPVKFGDGQAFASLTDGTILLLDLEQLRDK